ncbi:MAG: hypothetical protein MUF34_04930 [Polyangiaceae bacterium]|nr:hypothetical protein [Polyangiaceae bacterium]
MAAVLTPVSSSSIAARGTPASSATAAITSGSLTPEGSTPPLNMSRRPKPRR